MEWNHAPRPVIGLRVGDFLATSAGHAADRYTQDDAKALTLKAVELIVTKGLDGVRPILDQEGEFKHDELYVNVIDTAGHWRVYPPMPSGEGRNVPEVKDPTGKFIYATSSRRQVSRTRVGRIRLAQSRNQGARSQDNLCEARSRHGPDRLRRRL